MAGYVVKRMPHRVVEGLRLGKRVQNSGQAEGQRKTPVETGINRILNRVLGTMSTFPVKTTYQELVSTFHEGVSKGFAGLERRMSYSHLNAIIASTRIVRGAGWKNALRSAFRKWGVNPRDSRTHNCGPASGPWRPRLPEMRSNNTCALVVLNFVFVPFNRREDRT